MTPPSRTTSTTVGSWLSRKASASVIAGRASNAAQTMQAPATATSSEKWASGQYAGPTLGRNWTAATAPISQSHRRDGRSVPPASTVSAARQISSVMVPPISHVLQGPA